MAQLTYELSPLRTIARNDTFECVGLSRIHGPGSKERILSYGAVDSNKDKAKRKAISELVERVTWYTIEQNGIPTRNGSIGFAANPSLRSALIHSILEVIEHEELQSVLSLFLSKDCKKQFISEDTKELLYQREARIGTQHYSVTALFLLREQVTACGTGSAVTSVESFDKAYAECLNCQTALSLRNCPKDSLSYPVFMQVQAISRIITTCVKATGQAPCLRKENDIDLSFLRTGYRLFDVTRLCPPEFATDRFITCCLKKNNPNLNYLTENGAVEYAITL